MLLFQQMLSAKSGPEFDSWEEIVRMRIRERFYALGNVGAGVFLRLLRTPGEFVSQAELAQAAGVRSASLRVIKVYICQLRAGLTHHGLKSDMIQTGRHSYRLKADAVPDIVKVLV